MAKIRLPMVLQDALKMIFFDLKVPKCEIFDRSDFPDFYTKSSWVDDLVVKILTSRI